jgi:hypothetical protein
MQVLQPTILLDYFQPFDVEERSMHYRACSNWDISIFFLPYTTFFRVLGNPNFSEWGGFTYPSSGAELLQRFILWFWQISMFGTTRAELWCWT